MITKPYSAEIQVPADMWFYVHAATWSVEELAAEMHMSAQALRRKVTFWQGQGLLKEQTTDVYTLVEQQQQQRHARHDVAMAALDDDDDAESAMASAQDLKEEEAQVRAGVALIRVWVEKTIIVYIGYM